MTEIVRRYLERRSLPHPLHIFSGGCASHTGHDEEFVSGDCVAVVIPVRDEYPGLHNTLKSLFDSLENVDISIAAQDFHKEFALRVVCVVNNRSSDSDVVKENNRRCLEMLRGSDPDFPLPQIVLDVIDCSSPGLEIPEGQGVGYARKIGMDYAVAMDSTVVACLDADTMVSRQYVHELFLFAKRHGSCVQLSRRVAAAVTNFHHVASTSEEENAIRVYESFLKGHSARLAACGTIFHNVALGPTVVCTAEAYSACGGMNLRTAGEDFYFIQSLVKVAGRSLPVLDCCVHPSARRSERVPFGTGRAVSEICAYNRGLSRNAPLAIDGYPDFVYVMLQRFISTVVSVCRDGGQSGDALRSLLQEYTPVVEFLELEHFFCVWDKLCQNNRTPANLERAFQCWFDGLKIIRLIHYLMRHDKGNLEKLEF